jgi:hypothetical protein
MVPYTYYYHASNTYWWIVGGFIGEIETPIVVVDVGVPSSAVRLIEGILGRIGKDL